MLHKHTVEIEWAGRPLRLETGRIARQADGAVLAQYGGTSVLATVVAAKEARPGIDFFPLTVNYQEKTFAAGKIPGGYFKREGRPTEKETLTSRLIDRPIRPLFAAGFRNETQVVATVLSHDMENDPDIVGMIATSAALTLSGIPFLGHGQHGRFLKELHQLTQRVAGVRRIGAASLDLAWVAAGRFDGYWERDLKPWDMAAGILLVTEAGGRVTNADGADTMLTSGSILAANLDLHPQIAERLKAAA